MYKQTNAIFLKIELNKFIQLYLKNEQHKNVEKSVKLERNFFKFVSLDMPIKKVLDHILFLQFEYIYLICQMLQHLFEHSI